LGKVAARARARFRVRLLPAVVQDARTGQVLMLAYMNREALERTLATGETHFWSRSRQALWHKGATLLLPHLPPGRPAGAGHVPLFLAPLKAFSPIPVRGAQGQTEILKKIGEEAVEVLLAAQYQDDARLVEEVADLTYHVLVLLVAREIPLEAIVRELERRRR